MKVISVLGVTLLCAACAGEPEREPAEVEAPAAPVAAPEVAPAGTTGNADAPKPAPPPRAAAPAAPDSPERTVVPAGRNVTAGTIKDFNDRVAAYTKLRGRAVKGAPKLKDAAEPEEIHAATEAMAARIREARSGAMAGDVFTPQIRALFRQLLAPEMKGEDGRDARAMMKDDAPAPADIPFKVNAKYPAGEPLPTVPASVLMSLPRLPDPLEYRIIGKHLILLDTDADLIVDYMPNAIR